MILTRFVDFLWFRFIFKLNKLSTDDIKSITDSMKSTNTSGSDGISMKIIKSSWEDLLQPLFHLEIRCIKDSIFPATLKISSVVPIFKAGK